jgi:hypothetical protein
MQVPAKQHQLYLVRIPEPVPPDPNRSAEAFPQSSSGLSGYVKNTPETLTPNSN